MRNTQQFDLSKIRTGKLLKKTMIAIPVGSWENNIPFLRPDSISEFGPC